MRGTSRSAASWESERRFACICPAPRGTQPPLEETAAAQQRGAETILLVEDEEMVCRLARTILSSCGYRVLEAGCAREAIQICHDEDGPIDLMLTDVVMPGGMSGCD